MYIVSTANRSLDIMAKILLLIEKSLIWKNLTLVFENILWQCWTLLKKWKEKSSDAACAVLYEAYSIRVSGAQFACIPSKD